MLKNNNINTIVIEGADCKLKNDLIRAVHDFYKGQYLVITHGDIYEHVYALKNNLSPIKHTHGMQVLYVVCEFEEDDSDVISENRLYDRAVSTLYSEYEIIRFKVTECMSSCEAFFEMFKMIKAFIKDNIERHADKELNTFNEMYVRACEKYGLCWKVIDGQPYLHNRQIMTDMFYNNGAYETYDDKSIPDNLLYSAAYTNTECCSYEEFSKKEFDVQYPINSKILHRDDAKEYMLKTIASLSLYTLNSEYVNKLFADCTEKEQANVHTFNKAFHDDYIKEISKAKATVITNRDIAHLEMMTGRWYESVLANCVIFIDHASDPENKVLSQIYGKHSKYLDLLTVEPDIFADKVKTVINDKRLVETILQAQHAWYNRLLGDIDVCRIRDLCN